MRDLLGLVAACGGVKEEEKELKRTPGLPSWDHSQSQECLGWSGELVDLGRVWAEVLPVRCPAGCVWGGDADAGSIAGGGLAAPISGRVCRASWVQAEKEACRVETLNDRRGSCGGNH